MAAYHQLDDEVLMRSPNGSVRCHTTGSRHRPISVAGLITDAGVTLAVEGNTRRRLMDDKLDGSPTLRISLRVLAELDPTQSQLVERRPRSANAFDGPLRRSHRQVQELIPAEVVDELALPDVKPPCSTPEQPQLESVSSRGAWEGRLASASSRRLLARKTTSSSFFNIIVVIVGESRWPAVVSCYAAAPWP